VLYIQYVNMIVFKTIQISALLLCETLSANSKHERNVSLILANKEHFVLHALVLCIWTKELLSSQLFRQ